MSPNQREKLEEIVNEMGKDLSATKKFLSSDTGQLPESDSMQTMSFTRGKQFTLGSYLPRLKALLESEEERKEEMDAETIKAIEAMADRTVELCNTERRLIIEASKLVNDDKWLAEFNELKQNF